MTRQSHGIATWDDVLHYCRYSANPVGRLLLYLVWVSRCRAAAFIGLDLHCACNWRTSGRMSPSICKKDRVYIPQEVMTAHGYSDRDLFAGVEDERFQAVMRDVVGSCAGTVHGRIAAGATVDRRLSVDLELFSRGGLLVLDKIERQHYRVLHNRPAIGKLERVRLLMSTLARAAFSKAA